MRIEEATPSETDKVIQRLEKQLTERDGKIQQFEEKLSTLKTQLEKQEKETRRVISKATSMLKEKDEQTKRLEKELKVFREDVRNIRLIREEAEWLKEGNVEVIYHKSLHSKEDIKKFIKEEFGATPEEQAHRQRQIEESLSRARKKDKAYHDKIKKRAEKKAESE